MATVRSVPITLPRPVREHPHPSLPPETGAGRGQANCHVCGKPVDSRTDSLCRNCDRPVHIAWAEKREGPECSRIAPSHTCGVSFLCIPCYLKLGFE